MMRGLQQRSMCSLQLLFLRHSFSLSLSLFLPISFFLLTHFHFSLIFLIVSTGSEIDIGSGSDILQKMDSKQTFTNIKTGSDKKIIRSGKKLDPDQTNILFGTSHLYYLSVQKFPGFLKPRIQIRSKYPYPQLSGPSTV